MSKFLLIDSYSDTVAILNTIAPRTALTAECGHRWEFDDQTSIHSCCRCGTQYDTVTGAWTAPGRPGSL